MRDVELYATILGLTPPWKVVGVEVDIPGEQVTVKVDPGPGSVSVSGMSDALAGL